MNNFTVYTDIARFLNKYKFSNKFYRNIRWNIKYFNSSISELHLNAHLNSLFHIYNKLYNQTLSNKAISSYEFFKIYQQFKDLILFYITNEMLRGSAIGPKMNIFGLDPFIVKNERLYIGN